MYNYNSLSECMLSDLTQKTFTVILVVAGQRNSFLIDLKKNHRPIDMIMEVKSG